jgi:deazaflavin-dependent oxidoreductase (nitroreductase family)
MATDWNAAIIEEFRTNGGRVSGHFEGAPLLLLTSKGARTGRPHTTPMMYLADEDRLVVIASKGGSPTNPAWYYNLLANPTATVEVGGETFEVEAVVLDGDERDRLYAKQASRYPGFADYEKRTSRKIPVIALKRATMSASARRGT